MTATHRNSGFAIIEVIIVVAIVGMLGAVGFTYYSNQGHVANNDAQKPVTTQSVSAQQQVAQATPDVPVIDQSQDLDEASNVMQEELDASDAELNALTAELDSI